MKSAKEEVRELLDQLPEDASLEDTTPPCCRRWMTLWAA
jgi:hypothetical protein